MNIVVANLTANSALSAKKVLYSAETDLDRRLADMSIQLDEYMFLDLNTVDIVYVCRGNEPVESLSLTVGDSETVYFPWGIHGSFYCSPEIFTILGKMYKLDFTKLNFVWEDENSETLMTEKMLFLITRLGYKVNVKE